MPSEDKNWAKEYILDPLLAPEPSEETGPGSHFRPPPEETGSSRMTTPPQSRTARYAAAKEVPVTITDTSNGSPSSRKSPTSHRQQAFGAEDNRRRSSSLGERFPGDMSHRPLDQLRLEKAKADKSRHITKKHHIQPDGIDRLDEAAAGGAYHHGGPYDATLFARNNSYASSPVQAVSQGNEESLKATPKERIMDSLRGHRPLDGVASYAPGEIDPNGHLYAYEQGENMMVDVNPEGGAYKRWPGLKYHPDDIKGKGEPSFGLEEALKKEDASGEKGFEMTDKARGGSLSQALRGDDIGDEDARVRRSGSLSKRLSGGLRRGIGSLKKSSHRKEE